MVFAQFHPYFDTKTIQLICYFLPCAFFVPLSAICVFFPFSFYVYSARFLSLFFLLLFVYMDFFFLYSVSSLFFHSLFVDSALNFQTFKGVFLSDKPILAAFKKTHEMKEKQIQSMSDSIFLRNISIFLLFGISTPRKKGKICEYMVHR